MIIECDAKDVGTITNRRITGIRDRRRGHIVLIPDNYKDRRSGISDRRLNQEDKKRMATVPAQVPLVAG